MRQGKLGALVAVMLVVAFGAGTIGVVDENGPFCKMVMVE